MRYTLALLLLSLAGCIHPPDRIIYGVQFDPDDRAYKFSLNFSSPVTYGREYRPLFEPDGKR